MTKKQLSAIVGSILAVGGALGYSGGGIDHPVTAETAAHQAHKIAEVERRLERVETKTAATAATAEGCLYKTRAEREQESPYMVAYFSQFSTGMATLRSGGVMLVPLLFLSLAATAIVLDRIAVLRREQNVPAEIITRVYRLLERRKYDMAIALCETRPHLVMDLLRFGVVNRDAAATTLAVQLRQHVRQRSAVLYTNLFMLGLVAAVAPLLGLLGTVTGMIRSFDALFARGGVDQLGIVADGISVALLTTFAGLSVALPTFIAFSYLTHRANKLGRQLQRYGISLVRFLQAEEIYHPAPDERAEPGDDTDPLDFEWESDQTADTASAG